MNQKPTTADHIRQAIEDCKVKIMLEQMTIDELTSKLDKLEREANALGKVDRLFLPNSRNRHC